MSAPTVHTDLGVAWITRGADGIHIEPEEIPAVVAALLVEHDRLLDAADDVMSGRVAETAHMEMCGVVMIDGQERPGCWREDDPMPEFAQPTYGMCTACRSIEVALVEVIGTRDFSNIGESASYPVGYGCEACS